MARFIIADITDAKAVPIELAHIVPTLPFGFIRKGVRNMPRFANFKVSLNLPYIGGIEGTWEPDDAERKAAWEMYVELVTRIAVAQLGSDEGLLREALNSMYSLFATTRSILREYDPGIAQPKGDNELSFGYLAIAVLNTVLCPLLAKWHPLLKDYEDLRTGTISSVAYERAWEHHTALRKEIDDVRLVLVQYANLLAEVAGVPSLILG